MAVLENVTDEEREMVNHITFNIMLQGVRIGWEHARAYHAGVSCMCEFCARGIENPEWVKSWYEQLEQRGIPGTW